MSDLECCFLTYNCARELLDPPYFADCLYDTLSKRDAPPDLFIIALEELAPIGYAFLGGSFITPYFKRFDAALNQATERWGPNAIKYENLLATNAGMTGIMLFAQPDVATSITRIETAGVGVGDYDLGNKGAVGVRIGYQQGDLDETTMTFLGAHLAPMEKNCNRRNKDWQTVVENLVFTSTTPGTAKGTTKPLTEESEPLLSSATDTHTSPSPPPASSGLYTPTSHLFVAGDLNYRASDVSPAVNDHKTWAHPSPTAPLTRDSFSALFAADQLTRELRATRTMHHLSEAAITFAPTYKYSSKAQRFAASLAAKRTDSAADSSFSISAPTSGTAGIREGEAWLWAPHRVPSWCDRVLYLDPPFPQLKPKIGLYTSLPLQKGSDHQPVLLEFSVPLKALPSGEEWIRSPFEVAGNWRERRVRARRLEVAVGIVAYLVLTWEGRAVLFGVVMGLLGGWGTVRSLLV